jgi:phosphoserine/homoserine phosphotransferase
MELVCLDLEGVLVPEIWINFAKKTGIQALEATTRDIPDYDVLMTQRLRILREHNLGLPDIQAVIADMGPLPGAKEFVEWVRTHFQLIILSDTFYEFAHPLMRQLGWPTIFCHKLETDAAGMITDYTLRQPDQKRAAVNALKSLNFRVIAAGDSYNDTTMLGAADHGFLFDAPENVIREFPQFPALHGYEALKAKIREVSVRDIPA